VSGELGERHQGAAIARALDAERLTTSRAWPNTVAHGSTRDIGGDLEVRGPARVSAQHGAQKLKALTACQSKT